MYHMTYDTRHVTERFSVSCMWDFLKGSIYTTFDYIENYKKQSLDKKQDAKTKSKKHNIVPATTLLSHFLVSILFCALINTIAKKN